MSKAFEAAFEHTMGFEGGYSNHPQDRGGETYMGISRRTWPDWPGWRLVDQEPLKPGRFCRNPSVALLAREFYEANFWEPVAAWGLPDRLTMKVFDTAVNCGLKTATRLLQEAVGCQRDGAWGPKTLAATLDALELRGLGWLLGRYGQAQKGHYESIVNRKASQRVFLAGWLRRAAWVPPEVA